jgi:hypothetical protein
VGDDRKMKLIPSIISIITLISLCFGGYFWLDTHYASAQQVKQVEQRLDYKIKSDQVKSMQDRIWQIDDRCTLKPTQCDVTVKEEKRKLQSDLETAKEQMKVLEKK